MSHPLRCRCGKVQGHVVPSPTASRGICYCRDCQAYARFLGTPGIVDDAGGTEVVASLPRHVQLTAGQDAITCMSLSERGLLRWYAACCNTPIANTPRNPKVPYVGVMHSCLDSGAPTVEETFGRGRISVNTGSARRPVRATPVATLWSVARLMVGAALARASGSYRANPFFLPGTRTPIKPVRVLARAEREAAYRAS
jgi:hypothetical protein